MCAVYHVALQHFQKNCNGLRITNKEGKKTSTKHFLLLISSIEMIILGPTSDDNLFRPRFNPSYVCTTNTRKISNMLILQTL